MSEVILPCPLCGGTVAVSPLFRRPVCLGCLAHGRSYDSEAAAIAAHNRIASAVADRDRLTAENERLRAQRAQLREAAVEVAAAWRAGSSWRFDVQDPSYDADAHLEVTLTFGDMRAILAALAATAPTDGEEK